MRKNMNTQSLSQASLSFPLTTIAAVLLLMSQPVRAQVDADCTGSNPGTVTCTGTAYADGITHTVTGGDLTVNVADGVTNFGSGGFTTTATGNNSVVMTVNNSSGLSGTTASTTIGALTENGDITITTGSGDISGDFFTTSYGIRAQSTGAGDIDITTGGGVNSGFYDPLTGIAAIDASTQGGDINISTVGNMLSREYGIRAHANGGDISIAVMGDGSLQSGRIVEAVTTGDIDVTIGPGFGSLYADQQAMLIDTRGGAGATTINIARGVTGQVEALTGTGALAINVSESGNAFYPVSISKIATSGGAQGAINLGIRTGVGSLDLSPDAGATITVNSRGAIGGNQESEAWGQGAGAGNLVFVNNGRMRGSVNFAGATGAIDITNNTDRPLGSPANGGWKFGGASVMGAGNDRITNSVGATLMSAPDSSIDFGQGDDVLASSGRFVVGENSFGQIGATTFTNLERFENNGLLIMGATYSQGTDQGLTSNLQAGTRLIAHGVDFVAGANSRIALDAALAETVQPDCSAAPAADCLDFTGGTTSGTTLLTLSDSRPATTSAAFNEGIVLIEGASAAENFALDPNSRGYVANTSTGPAIQKGLVTYRFTYDEAAKQHKLTGVLADEGLQGATFVASAQEIWRTTTDTWFDRQAALRAKPQSGSESGLWSSLNLNTGERDFVASSAIGANSYDYNLKQDQQISHLAFGGDFINTGGWSLGGTAGYIRSTIDYDATKLRSEIGGFAAGLYGSYLAGPISVDALVNYNLATQNLDAKNLGLGPDTQIQTDFMSIGGRVDAGYRLPLADTFYLQPLVGVSYVTTTIDDMELPSNGGSFAFDGTSFRTGLGLRMGMEFPTGGLKTSVDFTGRWWNEMEGENDTVVTIPNGNTEVPLTDEFNGGFSEVAAGVNLASASGGGFSGFVNVKSKFASEYSTLGASAGFRYQW